MKTPSKPAVLLNPAAVSLGATFLLLFAGCVSEPEPRYAGYRRPPQVIQQPVYVYYPDYEVYYNNVTREYVYFSGGVWIHRREPPRPWARDLRHSRHVQMEFQDSPDHHHSEVIRRYPRHSHRDRDHDEDDRR